MNTRQKRAKIRCLAEAVTTNAPLTQVERGYVGQLPEGVAQHGLRG